MEGEGCVLAEKDMRWEPGRGDLEPQPKELGAACLGGRNVQDVGTGLSLGPSVGLVAPGTEDRVLSPGFTEEPCSQCAEQGDLWESMCVAFVDKKLINCQSKKETENLFKPT